MLSIHECPSVPAIWVTRRTEGSARSWASFAKPSYHALAMDDLGSDLGRPIIFRAFTIAAATDELCRPIHLLAALREIESSVSTALISSGPLLYSPPHPPRRQGGGSSFLAMQTQQAARQLASERNEKMNPAHLLLALVDQGDAEALDALAAAELDLGGVRRAALDALGAPADLPPIAMPTLTPAGTVDRPLLAVEDLNHRAWSALCWRQDHLPLHKIKRRSHYDALKHLEHRAVWHLSSKLKVDDDQRYSLMRHHFERVERRACEAKPEFVQMRSAQQQGPTVISFGFDQRRLWRLSRWLKFAVGWGTWFGNRLVGLRNRLFHLRTLGHFRQAPQL